VNVLAFLIALGQVSMDCIVDYVGHKNYNPSYTTKANCEMPKIGSSLFFNLYKETNGKHTFELEYNGKALNICRTE
jgi:hypothetical protein